MASSPTSDPVANSFARRKRLSLWRLRRRFERVRGILSRGEWWGGPSAGAGVQRWLGPAQQLAAIGFPADDECPLAPRNGPEAYTALYLAPGMIPSSPLRRGCPHTPQRHVWARAAGPCQRGSHRLWGRTPMPTPTGATQPRTGVAPTAWLGTKPSSAKTLRRVSHARPGISPRWDTTGISRSVPDAPRRIRAGDSDLPLSRALQWRRPIRSREHVTILASFHHERPDDATARQRASGIPRGSLRGILRRHPRPAEGATACHPLAGTAAAGDPLPPRPVVRSRADRSISASRAGILSLAARQNHSRQRMPWPMPSPWKCSRRR
jgi:hypothetical protein